MTKAEWEQWTQRAIRALDTAFPEILPTTEYAAWKQGEQLLPHALLCLERATTSEEIPCSGLLSLQDSSVSTCTRTVRAGEIALTACVVPPGADSGS